MEAVRDDLREHDVDLIYGTIRLIKKDQDAFLNGPRRASCVIFNLHVDHHAAGLDRARKDFRRLIDDRAIDFGGSYFLTYHRYADREQLLRCYPEFSEFLRRKRAWDPYTPHLVFEY